ncbi:MAG: Uma2 family endonuclease [Acidobacteria bacterium]|nr:Uma2 family endonuclease [Acidobacteriota bacterium]
MATVPQPFLTPEQYLEAERKAEFKSEYVHGEVFAMAGASTAHVQATSNLTRELSSQTRGRCRVFTADMRIHVPATGLYSYADIVVTCEQAQLLDAEFDTLLNPKLIVEVLSPSTEAWDRGDKFRHYRSIPSFAQYLLVSTRRPILEVYTKGETGIWSLTDAQGLDATLDLTSVGVSLALADVYEWIEL